MTRLRLKARGLAWVGACAGGVGALALAFVPAAIESSSQDGLQGSVGASMRGPLSVGDTAWFFVYVANGNLLTSANDGQFSARDTVHNAFVASSVDETIFVNGQQYTVLTWGPPPYPAPAAFPGYAKRWVETVECPAEGPPCNQVRQPAVLPGEKTSVLFVGWGHSAGEPNGKYVFKFTVHGTLNGTPTDLTATSMPITMTD